MICEHCGNIIDADSAICPYCGSAAGDYAEPAADDVADTYQTEDFGAERFEPIAPQADTFEPPRRANRDAKLPREPEPDAEDYAPPRRARGFTMPNISLSTIFSLAAAVISLLCFMSIQSIKTSVSDSAVSTEVRLDQIQSAFSTVEDKLSQLDNTVAGVQSEAYNQLASQTITITKDLTSLTGPVAQGKYNQMFIIKAQGSLNINTSFDWQKYNETTGGWVSIVFTGTATSNDEYGLRLENAYDNAEGAYVSILWANGLTTSGAGTYRCVITDSSGITKTSSEAIVQVTA